MGHITVLCVGFHARLCKSELVVIREYLEGQGGLISRILMGITRVLIWVIGVTNLLTKSP